MPAHAARRTVGSRALSVLSLAAVLTVSGCSLPGLPGPTGAPTPHVEQVAAVAPAPVQDVATPPKLVVNDLANGAASHTLGAAENQLVVDYWTTEAAASWTSASSPIIRLSAKVAGSAGDKAIKITRFNARVDALNTVLANDTGDFAIGAPHSYSSAIVLPANPGAESTRIVFTFDLLTETAPGSGVFTRQTVMDSLTIGYADPPAQTSPAAPSSK
jgi:hypothetical protein